MKQIQALTIIAALLVSSISFASNCPHRQRAGGLFANTKAPSVVTAQPTKVAASKSVKGVY